MTAHYEDGPVTVWHGDCIDVMRTLPAASVDAVVTDPPYNLTAGKKGGRGEASVNLDSPYGRARISTGNGGGFMGKGWDDYDSYVREDGSPGSFQHWCEDWAREAYRLLKPGGHLLAFGGTRTFHRLTAGIEDAGFEIRDSIAWLYGSGFPKSLDVSKAIDRMAGAERETVGFYESPEGTTGWKGQSKREVYGPSTLVDGERRPLTAPATADAARWNGFGTALKPAFEPVVVARKPLAGTVAANVLAHGTGALNIDGSRIGTTVESWPATRSYGGDPSEVAFTKTPGGVQRAQATGSAPAGRWPANVVLDASQAAALDTQSGTLTSGALKPYRERHENASSFRMDREKTYESPADSGGASRFFYTAKASTDERPSVDGIAHPTVKPVDLMRWLVKLVTPPGGTVLEPFAGSGTTVEAAVLEGFHCIAIEREADYLPLILKRIRKPHAVGLDLDFEPPAAAPRPAGNGRDGEASAARRYTDRGGTNFAPLPGRRYNDRPQPAPAEPGIGLDFGEWEA